MKIIVPMAGMGKRMRPHTLTIPKPLIKIAGKPIVERLVNDIAEVASEKIDEVAFVIGNFGEEVENNLLQIADNIEAKGRIYYQKEALGTAHAILCAKESLKGKVTVAFADTLFKANFSLNEEQDGVIWVHKVKDPSAFGVVKINEENIITAFIEKPQEFVSDLAIIGIYYFKDGENLAKELQFLIDNKVIKGGEYQLTDALQNMMTKNIRFSTDSVDEWLDCGNKNATVYANQRVLEFNKHSQLIDRSSKVKDSIVVHPCHIGKNVEIDNCIIGPHVSIENDSKIKHSIITNSIIQSHSIISNANLDNSMIGNSVAYKGSINDVSIGDFTRFS